MRGRHWKKKEVWRQELKTETERERERMKERGRQRTKERKSGITGSMEKIEEEK